jgi:6-pyruvoyltetrahydropterin/6-carboxytetrahydropterin synthase
VRAPLESFVSYRLITARASFEAARTLTRSPEDRLQRRHGHGFSVDVSVPQAPGDADTDVRLSEALAAAVAPLDYADLNGVLSEPHDEAIAAYIAAALGAFPDASVMLAPTSQRRLERSAEGALVFGCRYRFEAAHYLPHVPAGHKCGRLHGHSFEVLIRAGGAEHSAIDRAWQPYAQLLSHHCLNDLAGLENPTSECLAQWLWTALKAVLPTLLTVTVYETGRCGATFDGAMHSIWRAMTFDAALARPDAPSGDPRRRTHGHTYGLRLHLCGPLDPRFGWALDFADVQRLFAPVYEALDHRALSTVHGLTSQSTPALADWIASAALEALPAVCRVDLEETPGHGILLSPRGPVPFHV